MKNPFLNVQIRTLPLVKAFLENNFGTPVTIPEENILYKFACSQLQKSNTRPNEFSGLTYTTSIDLNICERNFKFDGFEINDMNTRAFNTAIVDHIRQMWRSNLKSLLIAQSRLESWKIQYIELHGYLMANNIGSPIITAELTKEIKRLKNSIETFDIPIKDAIQIVVYDFLKLTFDDLPYETVKKDFYRHRKKIFSTQMSPN